MSDPRDKIWSVIGLAVLEDRAAVEVDYTLPVESSFRTLAKLAARRTRVLCRLLGATDEDD